jgi:hypothetical protein
MSFLDPTNINAPEATFNPEQTIGPAVTMRNDISTASRPTTIMATNPDMEQRAHMSAPFRRNDGVLPPTKATNVMVRSANQRGEETDTPQGFIWGLRGEGDAPTASPVKWGTVALGLGALYLLCKMLRK